MTYEQRLKAIGISLLQSYTKSKEHHQVQCDICNHKWSSTPLANLQSHRKYGTNGCPNCNEARKQATIKEQRQTFLSKLDNIPHIELLSEYDGAQAFQSKEAKVKFRNNICGHEFETYPAYIVNQKTDCPICGKEERIARLSARNLANRFYTDPTQWMGYKSIVVSMTRKTYLANKHIINPHNHPIGKCGTDGAYQVDHIVSKAIGFKLGIPPELLSHHTNLQMLPWEENLAHKDKFKGDVPEVLKEYFTDGG